MEDECHWEFLCSEVSNISGGDDLVCNFRDVSNSVLMPSTECLSLNVQMVLTKSIFRFLMYW